MKMHKCLLSVLLILAMLVVFAMPGFCATVATDGRQDTDKNYNVEYGSDFVIQRSTNSVLKSANTTLRRDSGLNYGGWASGTDDFVVTLSPAPTVLVSGAIVMFRTRSHSTSGACTLDVDGDGDLTATALYSQHDASPAENYIETGSIVIAIFDGTAWQIQTPDANP